jgi:hypothetical protein
MKEKAILFKRHVLHPSVHVGEKAGIWNLQKVSYDANMPGVLIETFVKRAE